MKYILEADNIQLDFNGRPILSGIWLRCETGRITGLLGRNGQGKSCLMQLIFGSLPGQISVRINGTAVSNPYKTPGLLSYLPQFHFIPASLSIHRVLKDFQLERTVFEHHLPQFKGRDKIPLKELSGGEYRLIELYVTLQAHGKFALLDEPFTHLSPLQVEQAKVLLYEAREHKGILLTDHLFREVLTVSEEVYMLSGGHITLCKDDYDLTYMGYIRMSKF